MSVITSIYFPDPATDHPAEQAARRDVAATLRTLIEQVSSVDVSCATLEDLTAVASTLLDAATMVDRLPKLDRDDRDGWPVHENGQFERGPISGRANAAAAPLEIERDGDRIRASATFGTQYEGSPGNVHGGVLAAAFDDLLGCAQLLSPTAGPTGTLTIRYVSLTPIGAPIDFEAWVDRVDGRKIFCRGTARHDDTVLVEAEAVFIGGRTSE